MNKEQEMYQLFLDKSYRTKEELIDCLHSNNRKVRDMIHQLRAEKKLIISHSGMAGYYLGEINHPLDYQDAMRMKAETINRINSLRVILDCIEHHENKLKPQQMKLFMVRSKNDVI